MAHCKILKISDNEITWFTGIDDFDKAVKFLKDKYNIPLILLSKGKSGSAAYYKDIKVERPACLKVKTIETTGAGDTFFGSVLNYILEHGLENLTEDNLTQMLDFANAAAGIITTRKGALKVMPALEEINSLIQ